MKNSFEYKENNYFEEGKKYTFKNNDNVIFESEVHFAKGFYWTNEGSQYKAITIKVKTN